MLKNMPENRRWFGSSTGHDITCKPFQCQLCVIFRILWRWYSFVTKKNCSQNDHMGSYNCSCISANYFYFCTYFQGDVWFEVRGIQKSGRVKNVCMFIWNENVFERERTSGMCMCWYLRVCVWMYLREKENECILHDHQSHNSDYQRPISIWMLYWWEWRTTGSYIEILV